MFIIRKSLLVILAALLPVFLFTLAIDVGVLRTAGSSAPIKKILADSGIYNSLIPGLLDQAKTSGGDQGGGVNLTDPAIKQAAENTFTPQYVQTNTEKILDSIFVWLNGKTPQPDFKIDLAGLKSTFATEAGKAAERKATTLPACASGLSGSNEFDAFSATCLPRGLTPAQVAAQVQNDINSGQGFIKDPVLTADTVKGEKDCPASSQCSTQSVFQNQYKNAPKVYQEIKKTPIILAVLAFLITVGIVFISSSRAAGLRRAGIIFLVIGIFMLLFAWALNYGVNQKALPKIKMDNQVVQDKVKNLVSDVTAAIDKNYWLFGGVYAALGAAGISGSIMLNRKSPGKATKSEAEPAMEPETPKEDVPAEKAEAPAPKPKAAKPKKIDVK